MRTQIAVFITPLPRPWMSRPPINCAMEPLVPATTKPMAKITMPTISGRAGPTRSHNRPATTVANSMPMTNSEKAQA